jgi:hypothetical protein
MKLKKEVKYMSEDNIEKPNLIINIAIAGNLPEDQHSKEVVFSKVKRVIDTTLKHTAKYANLKFNFSEKSPILNFLTSSVLTDGGIIDELKKYLNTDVKFICISDGKSKKDISTFFDSVSELDTEYDVFKSNMHLILSWLCDQADFSIILKDDESSLLYEFLKSCKQASVPTVSIEKVTDRHMLWTESSYYDSYDDGKLEAYLDTLLNVNNLLICKDANKNLFGRKLLWGNLYDRYMKKYRTIVDTSKPCTRDTIIEENSNISSLNETGEAIRKNLIKWFNEFDKNAIEYANKYRASIYLRAVIPLVVTIVLAIGFYTETLLSPWEVNIPGTRLQVWSIIAGLAFFIHALLNLYVFKLSENKIIKSWHKSFLDNRFIAEKLRIAIHFIPFGIPINFVTSLNKYGIKGKYNKRVINQLRCILKDIGLPDMNFNKVDLAHCLIYLEELVRDQIDYHKNSANRYAKIYNKLKQYGKVAFYIGFIFVLFRGCLQLYFAFFKIDSFVNGKELHAIVKSFTNMLALLFPAWAGYFSSKLTLCNFEGLYNNDTQMLEELSLLRQMINDEKQKEYLAYGDLYNLAREVTSLLLGENSEWYSQINTKIVTKL